MSSEVMTRAGPASQRMRGAIEEPSSSPASTDISSAVTPPRSFSSAACGASAMPSASRSTTVAMAPAASVYATRSAPCSPWMPRPSSARPAPILERRGAPGSVQVSSDIPRVRTRATVRQAAAATASRSSPRAARWPATLCTSTVPAMPRACGRSGSATSSSTTTIATLSPNARARSAASPKFSRSPV